jgi:hypothetical protein
MEILVMPKGAGAPSPAFVDLFAKPRGRGRQTTQSQARTSGLPPFDWVTPACPPTDAIKVAGSSQVERDGNDAVSN